MRKMKGLVFLFVVAIAAYHGTNGLGMAHVYVSVTVSSWWETLSYVPSESSTVTEGSDVITLTKSTDLCVLKVCVGLPECDPAFSVNTE